MLERINEMAGPYQMFSELCDLIVLEVDVEHCAKSKNKHTKKSTKYHKNHKNHKNNNKPGNKEIFAKYYEEVPLSFMPEFVSQHLGKTKYLSVCFDYGHGECWIHNPLCTHDRLEKTHGLIFFR